MATSTQTLAIEIDVSHLVTEDDTPVDNWDSEKQQRLAIKTLFTSYKRERSFATGSDIGIFATPHEPAIVPDILLSLDVSLPEDRWAKGNRSYFIWNFGKPPELVVEIVSNKEGNELTTKREKYAQLGVWYYLVYDPQTLLSDEKIQIFERYGPSQFKPVDNNLLYWLDLGVTLWEGSYEGTAGTYFRFTDIDGNLLLNDEEYAAQQRQRAENAEFRAENAEARAEKLAAQLRKLGIDPDSIS